MSDPQNDVIDVGEVLARISQKRGWVAGGALAGLLLAAAVAYAIGPRYEASTTLLVKGQSDLGSPLARLGGLSDLLSVGGLGSSPFETEMEVITSRSVIGAVVDSLGMQARVAEPRGTPLPALFARARWQRQVPEDAEYRFDRAQGGYRVTGPGAAGVARPGQPFRTAAGTIVLRAGTLPGSFAVKVRDYEDAVTAVAKKLEARKAAGDVARLTYTAPDPQTAAAVANGIVGQYLLRRRTVDRGTNVHRFEFLTRQTDSIGAELARAEGALRSYQEGSGVIDPQEQGKAVFERAADLRAQSEAIDVEMSGLQRILADRAPGRGGSEVVGYPTFLKNPGINAVLTHLLELRTERTKLLQMRTERDREVTTLDASIRGLEDELASLSSAYLKGLQTQRAGLQQELARYQGVIATMPAEGESSTRLRREVKRLGETMIALQTQLVQTRLAAIGEGGEVRQIDAAVAPRKPLPHLPLFLGIGLLGGLVLGTGGALLRSYSDDRVWTAREVQRLVGVPALELLPGAPLLIGGLGERSSVLVLSAGEPSDAAAVAERLARTTALRGGTVAFVDLARVRLPGGTAAVTAGRDAAAGTALVPLEAPAGEGYTLFSRPDGAAWGGGGVRAEVEGLEDRFPHVVVAVPHASSPVAVALLAAERPVVVVARGGRATAGALRETVQSLERVGVATAAVVLTSAAALADG
jgi:tyrosine-protein kinase Etk/Wzc